MTVLKHNAGCAVTARFEVWFGLFALFHRMLHSQEEGVWKATASLVQDNVTKIKLELPISNLIEP